MDSKIIILTMNASTAKCSRPGNDSHHNCIEYKEQYMLRPGDNPYNNYVIYSEHYYISA